MCSITLLIVTGHEAPQPSLIGAVPVRALALKWENDLIGEIIKCFNRGGTWAIMSSVHKGFLFFIYTGM